MLLEYPGEMSFAACIRRLSLLPREPIHRHFTQINEITTKVAK